jgi:hypothetical protein
MTDFSEFDKMKFSQLLNGYGDWFHAYLARLIQKADNSNKELLRKVYPKEVTFYEWFREIGQWYDNKPSKYRELMEQAGVD